MGDTLRGSGASRAGCPAFAAGAKPPADAAGSAKARALAATCACPLKRSTMRRGAWVAPEAGAWVVQKGTLTASERGCAQAASGAQT